MPIFPAILTARRGSRLARSTFSPGQRIFLLTGTTRSGDGAHKAWYSIFANREYRMTQPALRPQDVLVLAKLLAYRGLRPTMARLAQDLLLSSSEIHAALIRLNASKLIASSPERHHPIRKAVEEFLIHGVKYMFPAKRGEVTRGVPTGYAAPPLNRQIAAGADLPPVWPSASGKVRGVTFEPLYRTVPEAALKDPMLYELLALIDALREGRARERQMAERELGNRLQKLLA